MDDSVISIDAQSFEQEVLKSRLPAAVNFYSEECPPCEVLLPIFTNAAQRYKGHMKFYTLLRQANRELAERLKIKSSPTVLFYKNGQETCERLTGYIKNQEFREAVEFVLGDSCPKQERKKYECDAIILGGGPAGLTAAIYLSRAKLKTVVVDEGLPGGQVNTTFHISNYPGTGGTVKGTDLMNHMIDQAMSFGASIDSLNEVIEIDLRNDIKYVKTIDADYYSKCVVLSTGAEPRRLAAEGEKEFRGRGVHYCATCDGAMYQDKKIVVVGGGNSAAQEAIFLTRFAAQVTVIHQLDRLQASQVLQDELFKNKNIDVIWDTEIRKIEGDTSVKSVLLENVKTGETRSFPTEGVFVYIGMQPRTEILKGQVNLNDKQYIVTDGELQTSQEGVFAAGDVREKQVRQIATAVGDGAVAALMAEKFITQKNLIPPSLH